MARRPVSFASEMRRSASPFQRRTAFIFATGEPVPLPADLRVEEDRTLAFLAEMRAAFPFAEDFPLRERLDVAASMYLAFDGRRQATPKELRARAKAIEEAALSGDRERIDRLLAATGAPLPGEWLVGEPFADVLAVLEEAKPGLDRRRPPVPRNNGTMRILVRELSAIWTEGTGQRAGRSRVGPFMRFVVAVVGFIGIRTSDESLYKLADLWSEST